MPIVDLTDSKSVARFKEILEDMFWIKYLKRELKPFIPPIIDPRPFNPPNFEPEPQTNIRDLLTSELLLHNLKYAQFEKGDNSLLSQIKKTNLAKEVLSDIHTELKDTMNLIEKDISLLK